MKRKTKIAAVIILLLLHQNLFAQQLRLGDQPYGVEKSAVLDLVSNNQGLLLPRISDTAVINSLNPPDGMIIYFIPNKRLMLRSNGYWKEMTVSGVTSVNGNSGALTIDTGYIANFYLKVRSLFSSSIPITLSGGQIGITQATTSTPGYLTSADWNTFNNKQAAGNYVSDPGGNGIMVRTSLNTSTNRTLTGTANRITVTNGDGVGGNPTIDIHSSYAGQTSITTLGTIGTGTWNGAIISGTYGGTGVNNGTKTITLGNNFTTSGNFALTLTQTGTTNVTLPIAGTLATLSGTETFSNKTLTASTNVIGGVTMTLGSDATGDMYYRNSSGILTRIPIGTSGQSLKVTAGVPVWAASASQYLPATAGTAGQQLRSDGTNYLNKTTTTYNATPGAPSGTTSTTGVMMGLGASITPGYSGRIMIMISGDIQNTSNSAGANVQIRYGTGTAPINGAALTGTTTGGQIKVVQKNNDIVPFGCNSIVTGLTVGTAYWIDLSLAATTAGTAKVNDLTISIVEL